MVAQFPYKDDKGITHKFSSSQYGKQPRRYFSDSNEIDKRTYDAYCAKFQENKALHFSK